MRRIHYDILIDGGLYEGSEELEPAIMLYNTVEDTCLREYYQHRKSLQVTEGEKVITLKEGKIGKPLIGVRLHYSDGGDIGAFRRLFPEEAGILLQEENKEGQKPIKVEVLNRDMEVVLEFQ